MTFLQFLFLIVASVTLGAAMMVVTTRNLVHAALWLIMALFGVAVLFVLLDAGFFAVVQVVIYIGAIAILMIFAIMLTRRVMQDVGPQFNRGWWMSALIALLFFGGLVWMLSSWSGFTTSLPQIPEGVDPLAQLGQALVSPNAYVVPFEVASVLLLGALIGSIVIAWERR
ncbi:MAG TPA: NADH-quinone oxidoreductase subunit J [Anaerolineales bacterium]